MCPCHPLTMASQVARSVRIGGGSRILRVRTHRAPVYSVKSEDTQLSHVLTLWRRYPLTRAVHRPVHHSHNRASTHFSSRLDEPHTLPCREDVLLFSSSLYCFSLVRLQRSSGHPTLRRNRPQGRPRPRTRPPPCPPNSSPPPCPPNPPQPLSPTCWCWARAAGSSSRPFTTAHPTWHFTGVDPSLPMLQQAQQYLGAASTRVEWVCGTIDDLPVPSSLFDAATCLMTLHMLKDDGTKLRTLQAMRARMKTGAPAHPLRQLHRRGRSRGSTGEVRTIRVGQWDGRGGGAESDCGRAGDGDVDSTRGGKRSC